MTRDARYVCYLLVSQLPGHGNKVYIGMTNNMARRLRQHNGELKRGGARYTKRYRPWQVAATVRHFATEKEALRFEWAWQHPHRSRHLREHRSARLVSSTRSLSNYLCCAAFLVQTEHYRRKSLRLFVHHLPPALRRLLDSATEDDQFVCETPLELGTVNL